MGKSNRNRKTRCSCRFKGSKKSSKPCPKCQGRGKSNWLKRCVKPQEKPVSALKGKQKKNVRSGGGKMDSKHFSSRSTTDNLPSSLSTPGERAGLSSTSPATVDTSVTTSSANSNTLSPHLASSCSTSGPADITSHSTNPVIATEAEVDNSRLPPDANDSESSHSSTSDKSYDPKNDPSLCSSSSNSCSSLASSLSAVISSSSKGHNNDDILKSDFQGNGLLSSTTDGPSLSLPTAKNSITSSNNAINNGQNTAVVDTSVSIVGNTITSSSNSNKDNVSSAIERTEDQNKDSLSSSIQHPKSQSSQSRPAACLPSGSSLLKDSKPSIEESSQPSPSARGVKRSHEEIEDISDCSNSPKPSPQKNKKRCFTCSCRLELAQRTIGKCRCDHVFCPMHRLPELHDCEFNHKEDGRREAREKMVKPTRHMGTSFRRDDRT